MAEEIRTAEQADVSEQSRIRLEKLNSLVEEGKNPYEIVRYDRTHLSGEILSNYDALENQTVSIAGRMMSRRVMGKASFAHLLDRDGEIQIYVRRDDVGEDAYRDFKNYDLGDVIGVKGFVFKTKSGEISVHAQEIVLLTKALHPLPEKRPPPRKHSCLQPYYCLYFHILSDTMLQEALSSKYYLSFS